jgi:hypothetical protein
MHGSMRRNEGKRRLMLVGALALSSGTAAAPIPAGGHGAGCSIGGGTTT